MLEGKFPNQVAISQPKKWNGKIEFQLKASSHPVEVKEHCIDEKPPLYGIFTGHRLFLNNQKYLITRVCQLLASEACFDESGARAQQMADVALLLKSPPPTPSEPVIITTKDPSAMMADGMGFLLGSPPSSKQSVSSEDCRLALAMPTKGKNVVFVMSKDPRNKTTVLNTMNDENNIKILNDFFVAQHPQGWPEGDEKKTPLQQLSEEISTLLGLPLDFGWQNPEEKDSAGAAAASHRERRMFEYDTLIVQVMLRMLGLSYDITRKSVFCRRFDTTTANDYSISRPVEITENAASEDVVTCVLEVPVSELHTALLAAASSAATSHVVKVEKTQFQLSFPITDIVSFIAELKKSKDLVRMDINLLFPGMKSETFNFFMTYHGIMECLKKIAAAIHLEPQQAESWITKKLEELPRPPAHFSRSFQNDINALIIACSDVKKTLMLPKVPEAKGSSTKRLLSPLLVNLFSRCPHMRHLICKLTAYMEYIEAKKYPFLQLASYCQDAPQTEGVIYIARTPQTWRFEAHILIRGVEYTISFSADSFLHGKVYLDMDHFTKHKVDVIHEIMSEIEKSKQWSEDVVNYFLRLALSGSDTHQPGSFIDTLLNVVIPWARQKETSQLFSKTNTLYQKISESYQERDDCDETNGEKIASFEAINRLVVHRDELIPSVIKAFLGKLSLEYHQLLAKATTAAEEEVAATHQLPPLPHGSTHCISSQTVFANPGDKREKKDAGGAETLQQTLS